MKNFTCIMPKHIELWSMTIDSIVPAYPSIRDTFENQRKYPGTR